MLHAWLYKEVHTTSLFQSQHTMKLSDNEPEAAPRDAKDSSAVSVYSLKQKTKVQQPIAASKENEGVSRDEGRFWDYEQIFETHDREEILEKYTTAANRKLVAEFLDDPDKFTRK